MSQDKTWLRGGRLYIRTGWLQYESGERYQLLGGELHLTDGYLHLNGPTPLRPYDGTERRSGPERRSGRERRVLSLTRTPVEPTHE